MIKFDLITKRHSRIANGHKHGWRDNKNLRITDNTFVYFYPFNEKCISCNDHLQGRVVASWKGILYCPSCALAVSLINENDLAAAYKKVEGQMDKIDEMMLNIFR